MDRAHYLTSLMYMMDHLFLFGYWGVPFGHRVAFAAFFGVFAGAGQLKRQLKAAAALSWPPGASPDAIESKVSSSKLTAAGRKKLWRLDLVEMVSEFGLFWAFVGGMGSTFETRGQG